MKKLILVFTLISALFSCTSKHSSRFIASSEEGNIVVRERTASLYLDSHPKEVLGYINEERAPNLEKLRGLCNYLTDVDILRTSQGYLFPKRRKSFKRHVKKTCENIEMSSWTETPLTSGQMNQIYELVLLKKSMESKAREDVVGMTFKNKISMGLTSFFRKNDFTFSKRKKKKEAKNIKLSELKLTGRDISSIDPKNSPFFTNISEDTPLYKRFGLLAKRKKIKPKKDHMVVIFDGESTSGSAPKVKAIDTNLDDEWSVKWGDELHTDVVGSRIFAGLGFDVDHPYYRKKDTLTLVFPKNIIGQSQSANEMLRKIKLNFSVNIEKFISETGVVDEAMAREDESFLPYIGLSYARFVECAIEGRPDRVKRMGPMMTGSLQNQDRRELRGSLLAHLWIDNWDTREENTLMALNHEGKRVYHTSGAFSDLGTSFGVKVSYLPTDFRVGLVNDYSWNILLRKKRNEVKFKGQINAFLAPYKSATYMDMKWMARKIARFGKKDLEKIVDKSGWPKGLAKLYFYKIANRRADILRAFDIEDPHPIEIDRNYTYSKDNVVHIKNGRLIKDFKRKKHPFGYVGTKGRMRNYGQGKVRIKGEGGKQ